MRMKRLREHREAKGLSREALARLAGVSAAVIEAHERGVKDDTYVSSASRLAEAMGLKMEDLFAPEDMGCRIKERVPA